MKILKDPSAELLEGALKRPTVKLKNIKKTVKPILKMVREKGDKALHKYNLEYDHVQVQQLIVTKKEIKAACNHVDDELKDAINVASKNIAKFHEAQRTPELEIATMPGVVCQEKKCSDRARRLVHTRWYSTLVQHRTNACHTGQNCWLQ